MRKKGLISKLDYVNDLGAKTICISRINSKESPQQLDSIYGDEGSLKRLKKAIESRG